MPLKDGRYVSPDLLKITSGGVVGAIVAAVAASHHFGWIGIVLSGWAGACLGGLCAAVAIAVKRPR